MEEKMASATNYIMLPHAHIQAGKGSNYKTNDFHLFIEKVSEKRTFEILLFAHDNK